MSDAPKFQDLVGEGLPPAEHERLERVHEMLIAAGPPPELPPELEEVPDGRSAGAAPERHSDSSIATICCAEPSQKSCPRVFS